MEKKKGCVVFFFLWQFWWVRVPRLSQVTGVTFLMRQTFLCVQAMWLVLHKMWIWSTVGCLLHVWQEKEGRAGKSYSAEGWDEPLVPGSPASTSLCWTDRAHLAKRETMALKAQNRGRTLTPICVKFRFEWWSRKFRLCMKWSYSKSWYWFYWLTFSVRVGCGTKVIEGKVLCFLFIIFFLTEELWAPW